MSERHYVYMLKPVNVPMDEIMTTENEQAMTDHFNRLKVMLAEGRLVLAGPCEDEAFGVVIFTAESDEDAERIMNDDPAVLAGLMTAELHPFRVSLVKGE